MEEARAAADLAAAVASEGPAEVDLAARIIMDIGARADRFLAVGIIAPITMAEVDALEGFWGF